MVQVDDQLTKMLKEKGILSHKTLASTSHTAIWMCDSEKVQKKKITLVEIEPAAYD